MSYQVKIPSCAFGGVGSIEKVKEVIKKEKSQKVVVFSDEGIKEHFESWHTLGALDEDEILHRIELHIDELPKEMHKEHRHIVELIEKRRSRIREKVLEEHPELAARLEQNRIRLEKRLEKQNPESMRKWKEWKKRD